MKHCVRNMLGQLLWFAARGNNGFAANGYGLGGLRVGEWGWVGSVGEWVGRWWKLITYALPSQGDKLIVAP